MQWLVISLLLLSQTALEPSRVIQPDAQEQRILFEKPIGETGQRLVVTRTASRSDDALRSLRPPTTDLRESFYEERVELRSVRAAPILLAARIRVEDGTTVDKGTVILDALIEPYQIVLAFAEGADLGIWQIGIGQTSTCWRPFEADRPWTDQAAPHQLDNDRVAMKLARDQQGLLTVEVTDIKLGKRLVYRQVENGLLVFKAE